MKDQKSSFPWDLPWETEDPEDNKTPCCDECYGEDVHGASWEPTLTIDAVSHLLDQLIRDIQYNGPAVKTKKEEIYREQLLI